MEPTHTETWTPVADGALAVRLRGATFDVAEALRDPVNVGMGRGPGLAGGDASLAVFYAYMSRAFPDGAWEEAAQAYLERAVDQIATVPTSPSFFAGFPGVAWAVEHLVGKSGDGDDEDANESIDESLEQHLDATPWRGSYDWIGGLAGIGAYALERLPRPSGRRCLELVVARLDDIATRIDAAGGEQVTWWTDPAWLPEDAARRHPNGYYSLGVAHGVPGTIPILAGACRAGIAADRARPLLAGAMRWLRASRLPEGGLGHFERTLASPHRHGSGGQPARAAWCYGDPGVAGALLAGARAVKSAPWEREALDLALLAARRSLAESPAESGVVDAPICHGTSGLAHLFNRLHHETGAPELADAARLWLERTLEIRRSSDSGSGDSIAGFPAYLPGSTPAWSAETGVLTGAAGVAMVMISAITGVAPDWDRMLACSLPAIAASNARVPSTLV